MRTIDYAYLIVLAGLWTTVLWYWTRARRVGELWLSCVCLVAVISLKIGVIAHPLNRATGGIYLDQLLIHLIAIVLVTLLLSWLVRARFRTRRVARRSRLAAAAAMLAFLLVTWLLAPVYGIAPDATWIPADVQTAPVMAAHWLGFHLYLTAFTIAFIVLARPVAGTVPKGRARLPINLMITGAGLFGFKSAAEAVAQIAVILTSKPEPDWLVAAVNYAVLAVFALFFTAVTLPLLDRFARTTPDADPSNGTSLWEWARTAG